jgi:hypothetical protein
MKALRKGARRNHGCVAVLAGAARADEAVLRALVALDACVLEGRPVGLAVAKPRDVARGDLLQRNADELGRTRMAGDGRGGAH